MKKSNELKSQTTLKDSRYEPKLIGARLVAFREFLGIPVEEMARLAAIKVEDLQGIERGKIDENIYIPLIEFFSREYGMSLNWLTSGEGFAFIKKGPGTPSDIFQFMQRLNDPVTSGLILAFVICPLIDQSFKLLNLAKKSALVEEFREKEN